MKKQTINSWLVFAFFCLMLLGIIMVYSASAFYAQHRFGDHFYFLKQHLLNLFVGLIALVVSLSVPYKKLRGLTWFLMLIAAVVLVYAAIIGKRWIFIGTLHFQAVDVAKLAIILFFADSLSRKEKYLSSFSEGLFPHLFYLLIFALLVLMQPDFSSATMLILIGLTMLFVSPVRITHLALTGVAILPLLVAAVIISPYKMRRVFSFLNPGEDLSGMGYQVHQSLVSLGRGGITGVGFAESTQKMFFLPEAHTDFIFAIIGEEWGLIGTLAIVALFGIILFQGAKIARQARDRLDFYLVVGITAHFVLYATINMMVTLRLLPATGLPMPFISYGGTALVLSCFLAGLMLNVSAQIPAEKPARRAVPQKPVARKQAAPRPRNARKNSVRPVQPRSRRPASGRGLRK